MVLKGGGKTDHVHQLDSGGMETVSSYQSSPAPLLPPCRICEDKASGLHYGVNTCEACKGFFRRSLNRKGGYQCSGKKKCKIGLGKRNSCAYCRYQKCLDAGMSKDAIKTGRYTHEKRTRDIEEVRRLMGKGVTVKEEMIKVEAGPMSISQPCSVGSVVSVSSITEQEEEDLLKITEQVVKASIQYDLNLSTKSADWEMDIETKQKEYYDQYKLKGQLFGELNTLSKEEYRAFYEATGIDLDDRRQMVKGLTVVMEQGIMRLIQFAKTIPGFEQLAVDDQAALIKAARFEYWFLGSYRSMNADLEVGISPTGQCYHQQEIARLYDLDFVKEVFSMSRRFKNLELSLEENSLLKAVVITFSDRCILKCAKKVEEVQWQLVLCLKYVLEKTQTHKRLRFAQVLDGLTALRDLTAWNAKLANSLKMDWPEIQGSPLLWAVWFYMYQIASRNGEDVSPIASRNVEDVSPIASRKVEDVSPIASRNVEDISPVYYMYDIVAYEFLKSNGRKSG